MTTDSRRLSILSTGEIDALFGLPNFSEDDRRLYFDLSASEREAVEAVHTTAVAVNLILQLGYFKAKRQFFVYELNDALEDLRYVAALYFPKMDFAAIKPLSKPTRLEQQRIILHLFDYHLCDSANKIELENKAARIATISTHPVYILRESLQYLASQRWVVPGYTFLQDMVSRVVTAERRRITAILQKTLPEVAAQRLHDLLVADEGMYRISALKHEPRDFSYKELQREVDRRKFFQLLHEFAKTFLATAAISNESGKYYG